MSIKKLTEIRIRRSIIYNELINLGELFYLIGKEIELIILINDNKYIERKGILAYIKHDCSSLKDITTVSIKANNIEKEFFINRTKYGKTEGIISTLRKQKNKYIP